MSTMDKIKDKLHIRRKSQVDEGDVQYAASGMSAGARESVDEELANMTPAEREAYFKEFEDAEKEDAPKKNSLIEKLIAKGNKRTEEQLAEEQRQREARQLGTGTTQVVR